MSQLPEVREADATPHIAAIYADIKESAALPQVNLIFRIWRRTTASSNGSGRLCVRSIARRSLLMLRTT